jgi:lipid-A-disaccharide synthase
MKIFLVAGEHSGDQLGSGLMAALREISDEPVEFSGVGGDMMEQHGFSSLFPLADVAVMGAAAIFAGLPRIVRRVYQTVALAMDVRPDVVIVIDSPEFTHPIARRIRRKMPDIPIVNYVSPSVWAWRPGRARKMRWYVDHIMALLPFEPEAHRRLGGPTCTYVGHPLIEKLNWIKSRDPDALAARLKIAPAQPVLLVLPGSRASEVKHLIGVFGQAVGLLYEEYPDLEVIIPTVASVRSMVEEQARSWSITPHFVESEEEKYQAFRLARAALAASGTVTLELAVAGVPMVVAYRGDVISTAIAKAMVKTKYVALANLVLGEMAFPELLEKKCTSRSLATKLGPLITGGTARDRQLQALAEIAEKIQLTGCLAPSLEAARIVLDQLNRASISS